MKIFNKINRKTFTNNNYIPTERNHYIYTPVIDIDSVLKINKRAYPQAYLEQCKYKLKMMIKIFTKIVTITEIIIKEHNRSILLLNKTC